MEVTVATSGGYIAASGTTLQLLKTRQHFTEVPIETPCHLGQIFKTDIPEAGLDLMMYEK